MAYGNLFSIQAKFRRLTGENLPNNANPTDPNSVGINDYINSFYNYDFPAQFRSLKLKDTLTFNTIQGIDVYPFNSEQYTTVEMPCYCAKREIQLFDEPWTFYGVNYNWQSMVNFDYGDNTIGPYGGTITGLPFIRSYNNNPISYPIKGIITAATQAANCQITAPAHGLSTGYLVTISGVVGMFQLNNNTYTITVNSPNTFLLNVNSTAYTAYTSGGTWVSNQNTPPSNFGTANVPGVSQGQPAFAAQRVQNILITANTMIRTMDSEILLEIFPLLILKEQLTIKLVLYQVFTSIK